MTDEQAIVLENDEKDPLMKDMFYRTPDGLREYHVAVHRKIIDFVTPVNKEMHGGDLSVRMTT